MIKYQKPSIKNSLFPIHPGEHLADCLDDYEMTPAELDAGLAVPAGATALLLDGCLDITPELALPSGLLFWRFGENGGNLAASAIRSRFESRRTQARRGH